MLNVEEIFARAIDLPTPQRETFLREACDGDKQISQVVKRLLESHAKSEESGFLLNQPPAVDLLEVPESLPGVGSVIGRYKLLEEIGEGGMGVVYMAEQVEDVRRKVALKIIKLGMDTKQVIARFEAERQAMALFEHPNITKVLDAGITDTGRPFFVMELVRGTDITSFTKSRKLETRERLELFLQVCDAVHHAHQKGIIHRDIKPSNILVTLFDGRPVAKVIDFGIAKAIGHQRLTEKTLFTRYAAMIGTPHYMSPEQAEMNGIDVDTRSDIYSLGVLLYELLTGTTPISKEAIQEVSPIALHSTLRDTEFEPPSSRIRRLESAETVDDVDTIPAVRWIGNGFREELDWVVMKALARDRAERYASANEFAADVSRVLSGEPVLAVPPSRVRKLYATLWRHRVPLVTATTFAVVLLLASVSCMILAWKASDANQQLLLANGKLHGHVQRLKEAESEIVEATNRRLYETAIRVALLKFQANLQHRALDIANELFLDADPDADVGRADEFAFDFCFSFDEQLILDVPFQKEMESMLSRIRLAIDRETELVRRAYDTDLGEAHGEVEHSPECYLLQRAINQELPKFRHEFYQHLVNEFRETFGEKDERVAEALQLHAASLIEVGKIPEAEARIREALALGRAKHESVSRLLLTKTIRTRSPHVK